MNTIYIDCRMGVSGVKLMGALADLLENPDLFVRRFNEIGFEGIRLERHIEAAKGVSGSVFKFRKIENDDYDMYADEIDDDDTAAIKESKLRLAKVHIRRLNEVVKIIDDLPLSGKVRKKAISIYEDIAQASSEANGKDVEDVRLHRTGSRDVIASVVGVCMLLEDFDFEQIIASPIATGTGFAMTSKGRMPIPIPALQNLLKDIPYMAGTEEDEICTLEGAAILKSIAHSFEDMPELSIIRTGAGFGQRSFKHGINCVRTYVGNIINSAANAAVVELEAYLSEDNMASLNSICGKLKIAGAIECFAVPVIGQDGLLFKCICNNEEADMLAGLIICNTSAKQVRRQSVTAYMPERKVTNTTTSLGEVRVEQIIGFGKNTQTPFGDDVMGIAEKNDISYNEAMKKIIKELN